ncbi:uncharacterized protein F4812DRAFT_466915 [Daldinia caldariorum]|uniref:uncharacterized protein n=1 Tax=Daldinia caldariorum TaxID=326644 RepID=UPI0020075BC2|nr:uncharacterized protein F4812DRAFT_466915 [Daldinia caldariorum]KAI1464675.1 hypothetical protein F4812DRAFT_466915 [Daldinia caldariorum]
MSSDAFSHQVPINGTIQTKVSPGNQTNIYYILVSNLPWQTSWQQLKDHVRTVSAVERVEVFNESTSGWVSVRGRENYDAALHLLNGGVFNGRALLADGKNATESIMIREPVDVYTTSNSTSRTPHTPRYRTPPSTQYSAGTPPMASPHGTGYVEWTSPASPPSYVTTSAMERAPYTMSVAVPYDYSEAPGYYTYDTSATSYMDQTTMVSSATMVQYPYEEAYSQQYQMNEYHGNDYAMYPSLPSPESLSEEPSNSTKRMVPTKQRKIIVKQLQPWVTFNQVQDLIRRKAGSDADKIQYVDLPLVDGQESNRGYALVTFQNEEVASKLVRRLNGYKYDGRELKADYTKEGVSENETVRSRSSGQKERREDREKREKKEMARGASSNDKKTKSHKSGVIIAHGSSSSSSKKSDMKEKPNKRH